LSSNLASINVYIAPVIDYRLNHTTMRLYQRGITTTTFDLTINYPGIDALVSAVRPLTAEAISGLATAFALREKLQRNFPIANQPNFLAVQRVPSAP
jgi:hypothetical protein